MIGAGLFIAFVSLRKVGPRRLRAGERAAAARRAVRRLRRRDAAEGQERLVLVDLPAAAGPAAVRPDAYKLVANSHCTPCVGCTKNCYDFNPKVAFLADLKDPDPYWSGYKKLFAAAFPGLVVGFFTLPEARGGAEIARCTAQLALYLAASRRDLLRARLAAEGLHAQAHDAVGGGRLLALLLVRRRRRGPSGRRGARGRVAIALAAGWVLRTTRRSGRSRAGQRAPAPAAKPLADLAAGRSMASHRALNAGAPEVTFEPEGKRVVAKPGMTLLEAAEAGGLPIESGCRMGVCGADPVCVSDGMEHLSRDLRRRALDARPARPRRHHADGVLRAGPGPGDDEADAGEAGEADALADRAVHLRPVGRARRRARQRDRRRHRRRPRAPAPSARADRPRRRGVAPPLQPHGHRAADLRPLGDAGPLPQPRRLVRGARRSRPGSTRARGRSTARARQVAARHGRVAAATTG